MKVIISVQVWGEWHSDIFNKLGMKNILSNINEIPENLDIEILIQCEKRFLGQLPIFPRAKVIVENLYCDNEKQEDKKLIALRNLHQRAIKEDAVVLFHAPDQFTSKNVYKTAFEQIKNGKRLVFLGSVRLSYEKAFKRLLELKDHSPYNVLKIALESFHQFHLDMDWDKFDNRYFSCMNYAAQIPCSQGFIMQATQGYIIAFYPKDYIEFVGGHDGQMLRCFKEEDIYCLKTIHEGICVDLSSDERLYSHHNEGNTKSERLSYLLNLGFEQIHLQLFKHPYCACLNMGRLQEETKKETEAVIQKLKQ